MVIFFIWFYGVCSIHVLVLEMSNDKRKKEPVFNEEREHDRSNRRSNRKIIGRQASHYREHENYYPSPDKDMYLSLVSNILS